MKAVVRQILYTGKNSRKFGNGRKVIAAVVISSLTIMLSLNYNGVSLWTTKTNSSWIKLQSLKAAVLSRMENADIRNTQHFNDDEIVVAVHPTTGKTWTLGEVRRIPTHHERLDTQDEYPSFYLPNRNEFLDEVVTPTAENRTLLDGTLVFNRVPKTASSTINDMLKILSHTNRFKYKSSRRFWSRQQDIGQQKLFLKKILSRRKSGPKTLAADKHMYFIETTRDYKPKRRINWINMVRDPIDRFVSLFHFMRLKKRWRKVKEKPPKSWFKKDLNKCILSGDLECQFTPESKYLREHQLTYFCGSAPECKVVGSQAALQKAKYNAEKYYSVIGLVSDLESSLMVMERYLPRYFQDAQIIYRIMASSERKSKVTWKRSPWKVFKRFFSSSIYDLIDKLRDSQSSQFVSNKNNKKQKKKKLSADARAIMAANMTLEYEFYQFARARLELQKKMLGIHNAKTVLFE